MAIKVAINGYGRIGRNILRAIYESQSDKEIQVVAINDTGELATNVHLTKYDTTHGKFSAEVSAADGHMIINGQRIHMSRARDPNNLPWKELDVDIVYECTGHFTKREQSQAHINAGAKKVIISAPAGDDVDATVVYGVNHTILQASDVIISNASCTTNCLAPLVKPLHEKLGIISGLMNTIHAYTNDQVLIDSHHPDLRRARSATQSIIPTKTGAATAVGKVVPELAGKLFGFAMRVPTINVSAVDFTFQTTRETSAAEITEILSHAAKNELQGIIEINYEPLVSSDFNHNPASAIYDAAETTVFGNHVKLLAWYDNEWGFSNRMLDITKYWMNC